MPRHSSSFVSGHKVLETKEERWARPDINTKMKKEEAIKCITDVVSSGAGHFVGAILSEVYNL